MNNGKTQNGKMFAGKTVLEQTVTERRVTLGEQRAGLNSASFKNMNPEELRERINSAARLDFLLEKQATNKSSECERMLARAMEEEESNLETIVKAIRLFEEV